MKVDFNFATSGEDYVPRVGAQYEITPGNWGKLKVPTMALQKKLAQMGDDHDGEGLDLAFCREMLDELKSFGDDDIILGMPSVVVRDFFTLGTRIGDALQRSFKPSEA
jgi:hypothetical protein